MIKTGYTVRAGFPKHVMNNEKTVFQIGCKDRNFDQNKLWHNVSFMTDYIDLDAQEEVEITKIDGFNVSEYNGKRQFTIFGSVERVESEGEKEWQQQEVSKQLYEEPKEPKIDITEDDLPF